MEFTQSQSNLQERLLSFPSPECGGTLQAPADPGCLLTWGESFEGSGWREQARRGASNPGHLDSHAPPPRTLPRRGRRHGAR